jgi:hypothetical protein
MFNPNQAFLLVQKLKLALKGFTLGVKTEPEKIFSICPKLQLSAELLCPCIGPKARKRIPLNLGGQFATLGAKQQAKNAQSWPQVFSSPDSNCKAGLSLNLL